MKISTHSPLFIACETVVSEVRVLAEKALTFEVLEAGLHMHTQRLGEALAVSVKKADGKFDPIILGYGQCANAVIGLSTSKSALIVPKVDDCIAMMLGSSSAYNKLLKKNPGTYFLSRGWVDCGITLLDEFNDLTERYGEARALRIQKQMFQNYKRLVYVDTPGTLPSNQESIAKKAAAHMNLSYRKVAGTLELLNALINGPWDRRFIVNPPGRAIKQSDFFRPGSVEIK